MLAAVCSIGAVVVGTVTVQVPIQQYAAPSDVDNMLPVVREMAVKDRYVQLYITAVLTVVLFRNIYIVYEMTKPAQF